MPVVDDGGALLGYLKYRDPIRAAQVRVRVTVTVAVTVRMRVRVRVRVRATSSTASRYTRRRRARGSSRSRPNPNPNPHPNQAGKGQQQVKAWVRRELITIPPDATFATMERLLLEARTLAPNPQPSTLNPQPSTLNLALPQPQPLPLAVARRPAYRITCRATRGGCMWSTARGASSASSRAPTCSATSKCTTRRWAGASERLGPPPPRRSAHHVHVHTSPLVSDGPAISVRSHRDLTAISATHQPIHHTRRSLLCAEERSSPAPGRLRCIY